MSDDHIFSVAVLTHIQKCEECKRLLKKLLKDLEEAK